MSFPYKVELIVSIDSDSPRRYTTLSTESYNSCLHSGEFEDRQLFGNSARKEKFLPGPTLNMQYSNKFLTFSVCHQVWVVFTSKETDVSLISEKMDL